MNTAESKASKGGKARASNMSQEERQEAARKAANARWGKRDILKATHTGEIMLGAMTLPCAVLEDGRRVLSQRGFWGVLGKQTPSGRPQSGDGELPSFLAAKSLKPFISNGLATTLSQPILYQPLGNCGGGNTAHGIEASLVPDICEVWLQARDAGVLHHTQEHIAIAADALVRALAKVGIVALVDEATGYQDDRARDALARLLEAYVAEELRPWVRTFPHTFYKQVYKLYGWKYTENSNHHSQQMGKFIHDYVYKALPEPVLPELKRRNPLNEKGNRKHKHHQFLTEEIGIPGLKEVITKITTILQVSRNKSHYKRLYQEVFPQNQDIQRSFDFEDL